MSINFWPNKAASIILLPTHDQSERLLKLVQEWTHLNLIGPALWVNLNDVEIIANEPPRILANIWGLDNQKNLNSVQVDLFEQLARQSLTLVRLIAVRTFEQGIEVETKQNEITELIQKYIRWSIPEATARTTSGQMNGKLLRINLIVTPTEFTGVEKESVRKLGWDLNIIASPEDRVTPWAGDSFVRAGIRFDGFVLAHLITAAGIWNGLPISTYELLGREESVPGQIYIPRVFVKSVITDGLARRVAAKVLKDISNPKSNLFEASSGVRIEGTAAIPYEDISNVIDWMIASTFEIDNGRLEYKKVSEYVDPEQIKFRYSDQFRDFLRFLIDKLKVIPFWIFRWFRGKIALLINKIFQGKKGKAIVDPGNWYNNDLRDEKLVALQESLKPTLEETKMAIISPIPPSVVKSTPELWRSLRQLVFSLLDGSELPANISQDFKNHLYVDEKRLILDRLHDVLQDPNDSWSIPDEAKKFFEKKVKLSWENIDSSYIVKNTISRWNEENSAELEKNLKRIIEIDEKINQLNSEIDKQKEAELKIENSELLNTEEFNNSNGIQDLSDEKSTAENEQMIEDKNEAKLS